MGRASRLATLMAMDGDGAEDEDDKDPSAREGQQSTRAQEIGRRCHEMRVGVLGFVALRTETETGSDFGLMGCRSGWSKIFYLLKVLRTGYYKKYPCRTISLLDTVNYSTNLGAERRGPVGVAA